MAPLLPDRCRRLVAVVLLACAGGALPLQAADEKQSPIDVDLSYPRWDLNAGTLAARDVELRQGPGTLIRAKNVVARGIAEGYENSSWDFTGEVHIELEGATLDADSATVVFADNHLGTATARGAQGVPAQFSHQMKNSGRRNQGRADTIDYDSATSVVHFAGDVWYTDGRNEGRTSWLAYNIKDPSFTNVGAPEGSGRVFMTIQGGKRVPAPTTPPRSTAQ